MALRFALLSALHESPATGYDLTQRFRTRLANVWNASHQQIYRELGKLYEEGWVEMEALPQPDKPDRKLYRLTDTGVESLHDWLRARQPRPATRDPLLVKLFAGDLLDDQTLGDELAAQRRDWQKQLAHFRDIEREFFPDPGKLSRHYRLQHLALRRGIMGLESWLAWADEVELGID